MLKFTPISALIIVALMTSARASAIYILKDQQYSGESIARGATLALSLAVNDQAVQRGNFSLSETVSNPGTNYLTGDALDFLSLFWIVGTTDNGYLTPSSGFYSNLTISLTFAGGIPSGTIRLNGETSEFILSGVYGAFSGTLASDFNDCNDPSGNSRCAVSGQLVLVSAIPEPSTILLLGFGVLSACFIRHRLAIPRHMKLLD